MYQRPNYEKKSLSLRSQLIGAKYFNALIAFNYAEKKHDGFRKDNVTRAFDHQISIAQYAMTLPDLIYREEVITAIFLHDTPEDKGIGREELEILFSDEDFARRVLDAVMAMTKKFRGVVRNPDDVFYDISHNVIASIAKGCDRIHNLQTMIGVFTIEKQKQYISETNDRFFPMIKVARKLFPQQVMAYENIKHVLVSQIELISAIHINAVAS